VVVDVQGRIGRRGGGESCGSDVKSKYVGTWGVERSGIGFFSLENPLGCIIPYRM